MNICVIGLGSMGKRRIRLLKKRNPEYTIIGIENNADRVESVSKEFGILCYLSMDEVDMEVDCAFICTPPLTHGQMIQECLYKGCHVFSEINLIDDLYEDNIRLAEKKKKVLFLSSTPIYRSEMQFVNKRVKENKKICAYQYHVGQYLPDWHPWDKLKDFFVSNRETNGCRELLAIELPWLQSVFGKIIRINVIKRKLTELELDFPDTYLIQLTHESGSVGNLLIDVASRQAVRQLEVINEDIYIKWDGTPDSLYEKNICTGDLEQVSSAGYTHIPGYADSINEMAYAEEIEAFFRAVEGEKPVYGFVEDMETLKVIDKIEGAKNHE